MWIGLPQFQKEVQIMAEAYQPTYKMYVIFFKFIFLLFHLE